jgi:hypothetical protein
VKAFAYWRDRLFITCCALYVLNRWGLKPLVTSPFFHGQFNDLLLIPCALPPVLWLQRKSRLRSHDAPPTVGEIVGHLAVWSVLFEIIGPRMMTVTGDVRDVVAYAAGALVAGLWWNRAAMRSAVAR